MNQLEIKKNLSLFYGEKVSLADLDCPIHKIISENTVKSPNTIAVSTNDSQLSYSELEKNSNQISHYLINHGIKAGSVVAVAMERSTDLVAALLGILKAGACYLPLDLEHPVERINYITLEAKPKLIITNTNHINQWNVSNVPILHIEKDFEQLCKENNNYPDQSIQMSDTAYIIYTSGSTGKPKGVMNSHTGLINRLTWHRKLLNLSANDQFIQKTPYTFDVSVWEFFLPLLCNGTLHIMPPSTHTDPKFVFNFIKEKKITTAHFVPTMLQMFLSECKQDDNLAIKHIVCSGEALQVNTQKEFFNKLPLVQLHNFYGPTEAAIDVTYWKCNLGDSLSFVPIGEPPTNNNIYILDKQRQPVPIGEQGELYIGGCQVAKGYLERADLTQKKFLPDPFSPDTSTMYASGDLAKIDGNGYIEYIGRSDFQVKLRGQRIELGEIEHVIASNSNIDYASAFVVDNAFDQTQELIACVSNSSQKKQSQSALREFLNQKLPVYMIPQRFIYVDNWPTTTNGKADRKALLQHCANLTSNDNNSAPPLINRPDIDQPFIAAKDNLSIFLVDIWRSVLNIDRIGIHDRIFELGGTSLQAAKIINKIQEALDETIFVVTMYENPTISQYAHFLSTSYSDSVKNKLGIDVSTKSSTKINHEEITNLHIEQFHKLVPKHLKNLPTEQEKKLDKAIFILSPPRSGTSLLRLMLSGHPELYGGNEFQLLHFETMADRRQAYTDKFSLWSEGLTRIVMDIKQCTVEEAKTFIKNYEDNGSTTFKMYQDLQQLLSGKTLVDKSPSYALDLTALQKAEHDFDSAFYIHLVREPRSVIASFCELHMEQALYLHNNTLSNTQIAELVWAISHQNTQQFLTTVPPNRQFRLNYEELVNTPETTLQAMCDTFGLQYHSDMSTPYKNLKSKAVDGIHADSRSMTDPTLLKQTDINPDLIQKRKSKAIHYPISKLTYQLAQELGCRVAENNETESIDKLSARRKQRTGRRGQLRRR